MKRYTCTDGRCGAEDCSTCFPFNQHEMEVRKTEDEHAEHKGDIMREREKDND